MCASTSNIGVVWREIPIEQAMIASHHRIDQETTAAIASGAVAIWIWLSYVPVMRKILELRLFIIGGVFSRFHESENKNSNFVLQKFPATVTTTTITYASKLV